MADIDIQQKRGRSAWPWIAGVVVLALIVWGVMEMTDGRTATVETTEPAVEQQAPTVGPPPDMTTPPGQPAPGQLPGTDPAGPGTATDVEPGTTPGAAPPQTDPMTGEPLAPQRDVPAGQRRNW